MLAPDAPEVLERFHAELDLVDAVARQVLPSIGDLAPLDELVAAGREGLFDAARRYDSAHGIPFRAYARIRVRGAIFDDIRQVAGLKRRAHERIAALEAALAASEAVPVDSVGHSAATSSAEPSLADRLGASPTAVALAILRAESQPNVAEALDASPEEALAAAEVRARIQGEIERHKPPREALVIRLHYFEGLTLDQVATRMGIDPSWASRLHSKALKRLGKRLRSLA